MDTLTEIDQVNVASGLRDRLSPSTTSSDLDIALLQLLNDFQDDEPASTNGQRFRLRMARG
jgi:hypothetical protein